MDKWNKRWSDTSRGHSEVQCVMLVPQSGAVVTVELTEPAAVLLNSWVLFHQHGLGDVLLIVPDHHVSLKLPDTAQRMSFKKTLYILARPFSPPINSNFYSAISLFHIQKRLPLLNSISRKTCDLKSQRAKPVSVWFRLGLCWHCKLFLKESDCTRGPMGRRIMDVLTRGVIVKTRWGFCPRPLGKSQGSAWLWILFSLLFSYHLLLYSLGLSLNVCIPRSALFDTL